MSRCVPLALAVPVCVCVCARAVRVGALRLRLPLPVTVAVTQSSAASHASGPSRWRHYVLSVTASGTASAASASCHWHRVARRLGVFCISDSESTGRLRVTASESDFKLYVLLVVLVVVVLVAPGFKNFKLRVTVSRCDSASATHTNARGINLKSSGTSTRAARCRH